MASPGSFCPLRTQGDLPPSLAVLKTQPSIAITLDKQPALITPYELTN